MYNEDTIKSLTDLQHIIHRPSAYIPNSGFEGHVKINWEIIDNATDELSLMKNGSGRLDVVMVCDRKQKSYSMIVRDNGRGIPVGKTLITSFAIARTSGKFDTKAGYTASAGLFGWGSTVTLALSSWFRVISKNPNIIGDVTIHRENIPEDIETIPNGDKSTGTIVMYTPDNSVLIDFEEYIDQWGDFVNSLSKLSLFSKFLINFYVVENISIIDQLKVASTSEALQLVDQLCTNVPAFTNVDFDKDRYIRNYFGISQSWKNSFHIQGKSDDGLLSVEGDIFILLSNLQLVVNKLTFVNTIAFDDNASLHISLLQSFIKQRLSGLIDDKSIRAYFVEMYKLPFWLVLNVRFSGAQFSGFAKTSFKDVAFKHPYTVLLNKIINHDMLIEMYKTLEEHIVTQYNKFSNKDFTPSGSMRGLLSRLNRPTKFVNCSTNNRMDAELFLVEGDSAKSNKGRGSTFQAFYTLGGKPYNGLTSIDKLSDSVNNIKRNHIFQDIIRILNITPGSNDLSNLNFGKIFIMADADTHGYHITDILIGDLYALCPALINNGHVYVTIPPLYSLNIKGREPIYIRDNFELNATLAYAVYYNSIDITFHTDQITRVLTRDEFVAFSEIVCRIGDELDRLSVEYMIPAFLLEQLSLITSHLNLNKPDIHVLRNVLGCDVRYIESGHLLVVSIGSDDIIVPLNQITELIYARILPLYRSFYYGKVKLSATTKRSKAMVNSPISIAQLYQIFKQLDGMFTIKRYKGLGSMPPEDIAKNCVNPVTRKAHQITNIGDLTTVFYMLGDDPIERKRLVLN